MADETDVADLRATGYAARPDPTATNRRARNVQDDPIGAASRQPTGYAVPPEVQDRNVQGRQDDEGLTIETASDNNENAPLTWFDVFSLITNKMVGTGVYNSPVTVYLMTGHKGIAMGLWGIGFLYSLVSMALYLDYAAAFPYTGGELVYLYEMTAHSGIGIEVPPRLNIIRRFLGDGLLAYVLYSFIFIGLWNSCTNAMQFGRMVLVANGAKNNWVQVANNMTLHDGSSTYHPIQGAYIQVSDPVQFLQPDVNTSLVRFIGVVALSILCLVQLASPRAGRRLNKIAAIVKIGSVLGLIGVIGRYAVVHSGEQVTSWTESHLNSNWDWSKALMAVIFSFDGWENATFVAGEIRVLDQHVLRKGFRWAVVVVGLLYLAVAAVFLQAVSWEMVAGKSNIFYPALFSSDVATATQAWACMAALSSLGSLNSIIYTLSRVKQAIGQANILPWSRTWKEDHVQIVTSERGLKLGSRPTTFEDRSPKGGLMLHWFMTVIVIAGVSYIPDTLESINVPGYLEIYAHAFVLMVLGALFSRLRNREAAVAAGPSPHVFRLSHQEGWIGFGVKAMFFVYAGVNLVILICVVGAEIATDGTLSADNQASTFPGFSYPTVVFGLIGLGTVYYVAVFGAAVRIYPPAADPPGGDVVERGLFSRDTLWSLLRVANVQVEIRTDRYYNEHLSRVSRFGRRWRARYTPWSPTFTTGAEHQHHAGDETPGVNSWYWVFGGQRWINVDVTPWDRFKDSLVALEDGLGAVIERIKTWPRSLFHHPPKDEE